MILLLGQIVLCSKLVACGAYQILDVCCLVFRGLKFEITFVQLERMVSPSGNKVFYFKKVMLSEIKKKMN